MIFLFIEGAGMLNSITERTRVRRNDGDISNKAGII